MEMRDYEQTSGSETPAEAHACGVGPWCRWEDLPEALRQGAGLLGWLELMPVQLQVLPVMTAGRDAMVQAKTGSGKTGAFLLPMAAVVQRERGVQALVLTPTRELAVQVCRDAEVLFSPLGLRPVPIYGGVGFRPQVQALEAGAQIVVGTPGRILDHLLRGTLHLDRLRVLIFDEADRMLSMGFYPDMKQLQRYLPPGIQTAMFSATYPGHVRRLADQFLRDPEFISLSQDQIHVHGVVHVQYRVPALQKSRALVKLIEMENPSSAIIFCNTKADVHFVAVVLRRFGYEAGELSADISQAAREAVLADLRQGRIKFLVATDVAGRGIDVPELSHVFLYHPPQEPEAYVHRTGRTGRAGAPGIAISLVSGVEELDLAAIARRFGIAIEDRPVPSDAEVQAVVAQRAVSLLEASLRQEDNIHKERLQRFIPLVGDLAASDEGCALLAMLVDAFYQSRFHAVELPAHGPAAVVALDAVRKEHSVEQAAEEPTREKRRRRRSRKKKPSSSVPVAESPASVDATDIREEDGGEEQAVQEVPLDEIGDVPPPAEDVPGEPKPSKSRRRRRRSRKPSVSQDVSSSGDSVAVPQPSRPAARKKIFLE